MNTMIYRLSFLVEKQSDIMLPKGMDFFWQARVVGWGGVGQGRRKKNEVNTIGTMHACGQQNTFGSKKSQSDYTKEIIFIIQYAIFCILVNSLP